MNGKLVKIVKIACFKGTTVDYSQKFLENINNNQDAWNPIFFFYNLFIIITYFFIVICEAGSKTRVQIHL